MSEHQSPDQQPPADQELSPRLLMYNRFEEAYDKFIEGVRADEEVMKEINDAQSVDAFDRLSSNKSLRAALVVPEGAQVDFRGVEVDPVTLSRTEGGTFVLKLSSKDRVTPVYPSKEFAEYAYIAAGANTQPTILPSDVADIDARLAELQENNEQPDYLTDKESSAILALVDSSVASPRKTARYNFMDLGLIPD